MEINVTIQFSSPSEQDGPSEPTLRFNANGDKDRILATVRREIEAAKVAGDVIATVNIGVEDNDEQAEIQRAIADIIRPPSNE